MSLPVSGVLASTLVPSANAEVTVLQCPSATEPSTVYQVVVATAWLINTSSSSAVTVSVSVVPAGGTPGPVNRVVASYSLGELNTLSLNPFLAGAILGPGDSISVNVSAPDVVVFGATGTVAP